MLAFVGKKKNILLQRRDSRQMRRILSALAFHFGAERSLRLGIA